MANITTKRPFKFTADDGSGFVLFIPAGTSVVPDKYADHAFIKAVAADITAPVTTLPITPAHTSGSPRAF